MRFSIGDQVVVKGKDFVGEILYIDYRNMTAEVEWYEYNYFTSAEFPLEDLDFLRVRGNK